MSDVDTAREVLTCVGGKRNVLSNDLCMTRLRLNIANPTLIDRSALNQISGVLGTASRGSNGIEVVFGPRAVVGVYRAFEGLTGLKGSILDEDEQEDPTAENEARDGAAGSSVEVPAPIQVSDDPEELERILASALDGDEDDSDDDDLDLDDGEDDSADADDSLATEDGGVSPAPAEPDHAMRLLVLNGPNINMLGIREPVIYGREDFSALLYTCKSAAKEAGFVDCFCYQSNHEGDLVDKIQDAYQVFDGIIINPGAYTHTSIAILDALKAVSIPAIEVHISDVASREKFRQVSYVRAACFETITGMGIEGYRKAIFDMADHLGMKY